MKRLITIMTGISFITSTSFSAAACGVPKGAHIEIKIANAPKKVDDKKSTNPLEDYVFNDQYIYASDAVSNAMTQANQLLFDKLFIQKDTFYHKSDIWKQFYNSDDNQFGNVSQFTYDLSKDTTLSEAANDFTYKANDKQDLLYVVKDNDATEDANLIRVYWFITSETPYDANQSYQVSPDTIKIPTPAEFKKDEDVVKRNGWIHLYTTIGKFTINFSAEIDFNFIKFTDKNGKVEILINDDTFAYPLGKINFEKPEDSFARLSNIDIKTSNYHSK